MILKPREEQYMNQRRALQGCVRAITEMIEVLNNLSARIAQLEMVSPPVVFPLMDPTNPTNTLFVEPTEDKNERI